MAILHFLTQRPFDSNKTEIKKTAIICQIFVRVEVDSGRKESWFFQRYFGNFTVLYCNLRLNEQVEVLAP